MIHPDLIVELVGKLSPTTVVVVEGKKDKEALARIGLKNIITISGKSDEELLDEIEHSKDHAAHLEVAILTDFDEEGKKKYRRLSRLFERNKIKVYVAFRKKFKAVFKVREIEDISATDLSVADGSSQFGIS